MMENIAQLHRKEESVYKPSDLWTQEDDLLFLKYCPSKRDKCYHALPRDSSCRPHEIVKLKIRDIVFKTPVIVNTWRLKSTVKQAADPYF